MYKCFFKSLIVLNFKVFSSSNLYNIVFENTSLFSLPPVLKSSDKKLKVVIKLFTLNVVEIES